MRESFSVTKDSIQLPYRRFLSDSAAGFLLLLLVAVAYYVPLFTKVSFRDQLTDLAGNPVAIGNEVKVFCLVAMFLLATPLGFAVNALSWLTLGKSIALIEERCFWWNKKPGGASFFPVSDIALSRQTARLATSFGITDENCTHVVSMLREALDTPQLAEFAPETHVRGLMILLRNIAFFLFCGAVVALNSSDTRYCFHAGFWIVLIGFLCVLMRSRGTRAFDRAVQSTVGFGFGMLFFFASDVTLAGRAAILFATATAVVCTAGIVGYYNCCSVILNAYYGAVSVGGVISESEPTSADPLQTITDILRSAASRAR